MLKRRLSTLAFPVLVLVAVLLPQRVDAQSKMKGKDFVVSPAADLKWAPMLGGPPGVTEARLWGDSTKGAYGAFSKFPAGWSAPLHTHPNDHKVVIVSGTWIHGEPGKPDARLGPGSYLFQPAGRRHTSACDAASECVVFIESPGKFGITMVEEMKKPAK